MTDPIKIHPYDFGMLLTRMPLEKVFSENLVDRAASTDIYNIDGKSYIQDPSVPATEEAKKYWKV